MTNRNYNFSIFGLITISVLILFVSCSRDMEDLGIATFPTTAEVFIDGFSAGLEYDAFGGSKVTAFTVDNTEKYSGTASMRFDVPSQGDPAGGFAAGIFSSDPARDLSGYNVLTFWAKASQAVSIDEVGFGFTFEKREYTGSEKYKTTFFGLPVGTQWQKYYIPIADPSKLINERGLFYYIDTPDDGAGYTFWVDEVQFENLQTIAYLQPQILVGNDVTETTSNNSTLFVDGLVAFFNIPTGIDIAVVPAPAYFSFSSSDTNVATVNESGVVTVLSEGTAVITAKIGEVDAEGSLTVESTGDFVHAPTPTHDPADVISIFSNAYTDVPVDFYNGFWEPYQTTLSADFTVDGDDILNYLNFNFVGIQFTNPLINASNMTHLHMDLWIPNPVDPAVEFGVKIVDFGADGIEGDPDPDILVNFGSPDPLISQSWISLDISLSGLSNKTNLARIILENFGAAAITNFYLDNVYLYNDGGGTGGSEPTAPAPDPIHADANVISVYSDAYSNNISISELNPNWGQSGAAFEVDIAGNNTLKYENFNFQGTQFAMPEDLSGMEFVHIDMWTADATDVKFTPIGGGSELLVGLTPINSGQWTGYDIPLSDFTGVPFDVIEQLKFDGQGGVTPSNLWLDNIYFYKTGGGATEPTVAAPDPIHDAADVISVFSDAYSNISVADFNPNWGQSGAATQVDIAGNNTLKYENFNYQGTQFTMPEDLSGMEFVHIDMWTADATDVKFTPIGGGSELLVALTPINAGQWTSYDIPLSDFTGVPFDVIEQLKFDGQGGVTPSNLWLDNIYFYKTGGGATEPTVAAPDPIHDAADVISVFSDAYSNISVADFNPNWGQSGAATQVDIAGNNTLKYENFNYQGTQFTMTEDLSGMEFVHIDMWTADATDVKFTPIGGGSELLVALTPINSGQWTSYDIPLSDFTGVPFDIIEQLKFDGQGGVTPANLWLDNIYFYKTGGGATEPTVAAPDPIHDAADVISVFSDAYSNISVADFNPNWGQSGAATQVDIAGNNTLKYENFNYQGTQFTMTEDLSGMEFVHIDMWTADATDVKFTPIGGGSELLVALTPINAGQWTSYDIPLSDFTGVPFDIIEQLKFDGQGGVTPSNLWLDNIYFYKTGGGATEPTVAAPDPIHDAADVISVFSDAYSNISVADFNPNWGQSGAATQVDIAGNNTLKYENFNYQGTQFTMTEDLSGMEFVHIDMWTADATDVKFTPIGGGSELLVALSPINAGQWTGYDIPLSDFTGVLFDVIEQLKFDGQGGVTPSNLWLDNIYFYKTDGGGGGNYTLDDPIDFEPNGFGADWTWNVFENDSNPPLEFVSNPDDSGINTSATVAKITALQTGNPWAGCETAHGEMGITWDLDASNAFIKIMVYKTVISDVGIKLVNPAGGAQEEIKVPNTKINEWEELTFDFSDRIGNGLDGSTNIDQIVIFPDYEGRTSDNVVYFDNIRFSSN